VPLTIGGSRSARDISANHRSGHLIPLEDWETAMSERLSDQVFEGAMENTLEADTPFQWPQWPTSRRFNPPAQSVPTRPPRTFSPSDAATDDAIKLSLVVDDLKNQLRQRPPNLRNISNRSDVVRALSRQLVARVQQLAYIRAGCSRADLGLLARSAAAMRGSGGDAPVGSWPPAASAPLQEPRRAARESLRHLLAWVRRAERKFPRI
jgi:hypothetical protein